MEREAFVPIGGVVSASMVVDAIKAGEDIRIYHKVIEGNLSLEDSSIVSDISIVSSHVKGVVDFSKSRFHGELIFRETTFWEGTNFIGSEFYQQVRFEKAVFKTRLNFADAVFQQHVNFHGASFSEGANFDNVSMEYPAIFSNVHFRSNTLPIWLWNYLIWPLCWLSIWLIGRPIFAGWGFVQRKKRENVKSKWTAIRQSVRLWRRMPTDFSNFDTSEAMYGLSNPVLKRYIEDEQWLLYWRSSTLGRRLLAYFWGIFAYYGKSLTVAIFWIAFYALTFAFIYYKLGCNQIAFNVTRLGGTQPNFGSYLYYSAVTLTTLGFGDIVPLTDLARAIVALEVLLGYFMLGVIISIFANTIARRS